MSRDGSGVYSAPAGTLATPNTTIESVKYNAFVNDLVQDANTARPVVAGGTGAITAAAARTALGLAFYEADLSLSAAEQLQGRANISAALKGHRHGLTLSNSGVDATNDVVIAAGEAASSEANPQLMVLASSFTKELDNVWVAGTPAGLRDSALNSGAIANRTYALYLVSKANGADTDVYATSAVNAGNATGAAAAITALQLETGGGDYVHARYIGSILRESGAILPFIQYDKRFERKTPILDVSANNPGSAAVSRTLSVPVGPKVLAHVNAGVQNSGTGVNTQMYLSSLDVTDVAPSLTASPLGQTGNAVNAASASRYWFSPISVVTNTSAQIRSRLLDSDASVTLYIATLGWTDFNL